MIQGEAAGIWQHWEPSGNQAIGLQLIHWPLDTVTLLRRNASYLFFKAFWWGLINSCLHSAYRTHMTAMPIHAPRFLIGWRDLLSWASHISGDSCYVLLTTLPLSHFVPKVCDKADKSQWSESRIGKEVRRDGKGVYPQELFSEYQSKGSHFFN